MVKYTAETLYNNFKGLAGMRKGNPAYDNDSTYWDGGRCNWGGSHNLREDCGTIARGFEKLDSLNQSTIMTELTSSTTSGEFESKKQNFLRKLSELSSGLQVRTGYSSSMFGICIIWADDAMSQHIESKLAEIRRELDQLKSKLGAEEYKFVEELKRIQFEIDEIKKRMEEKKKKAMDPNLTPQEKLAILEEIKEDGKLLEQKYKEHQQYSNKYRFDASKHISDLIERMKRAIEGKSGNNRNPRSGGSGSGGNRRKPNNPNDPFGGGNWPDPDDGNIPSRTPKSRSSDQPQNNQQLILIVVAAAVVAFIMMQKPSSSSRYAEDYDY